MTTDTAKTTQKQGDWVLLEHHGISDAELVLVPSIHPLTPIEGYLDEFDTVIRQAKRDPANVLNVEAYPGVVKACERQQKIIKAQMALLVSYRTGGPTPEVALQVLGTRAAVTEATIVALALVHPAQENKG